MGIGLSFLRRKRARCGITSRPGSARERHDLVSRHGYNGMSYLALYPGWEYFHPPAVEGFIAFERHNGVALAVGDPVCAPGDETAVLDAFRTFCQADRLTPAFAGATARFAGVCRERGWKTLKIGEEPLFALADYAPRGNRTKKVRSAANQAQKTGVIIEKIPAGASPSLQAAREMDEVLSEWKASRKITALSFTLRLAPLAGAEDKAILLARKNGRLEGFVTCIPIAGRNGYYIEDMIRRPTAPNGVSELLFLTAVGECRVRGAEMANLGLAPLRNTSQQPAGHRLIGHLLHFTFRKLNFFYKFKPLEHFKAKFGPTAWEDAFLIYRPGRLIRVSFALLNAFTPGKLGLVTAPRGRSGRPVTEPGGGRRWSAGHLAAATITGVAAAAYSALAIQNPALFVPFEVAEHVFARPLLLAGGAARGHLVIDSLLVAVAGGWYVNSARRD
jgi:lysylphosphatidylglycerol synthetase-like protein (DUF2156 family)